MEWFEPIREFILANYKDIIEYALLGVAYFLVFLYKGTFEGKSLQMLTAFKERTGKMDLNYDAMRKECEELKAKQAKLEQAVKILVSKGEPTNGSSITEEQQHNID